MSRDWQSYLGDILEACQRVRSYSTGLDQSGLVNYPMAYDAVLPGTRGPSTCPWHRSVGGTIQSSKNG